MFDISNEIIAFSEHFNFLGCEWKPKHWLFKGSDFNLLEH